MVNVCQVKVRDMDVIEQTRVRRKLHQSNINGVYNYINLDFILGSAAKVERLYGMISDVFLKIDNQRHQLCLKQL